jgi:hypothetical protein
MKIIAMRQRIFAEIRCRHIFQIVRGVKKLINYRSQLPSAGRRLSSIFLSSIAAMRIIDIEEVIKRDKHTC